MEKVYVIQVKFGGQASEVNREAFEKEILEALRSVFPRQKGALQVQLVSLVENEEA